VSERLEQLRCGAETMHYCKASHEASTPFPPTFHGQTVREDDVEVFDLTGHPKANRAYAWSHCEGKDDRDEGFVALLEIPPVRSPITAAKAAIVAEAKKRK
jgi:hypothetical protein